jgi:HPt (histidine-containing phosphotransfer) domain-containing protein
MDPVRSSFGADPEMLEILREFASELPERADALERLVAAGDREKLGMLAHQLKGAGAGYGFPSISQLAGALEFAVERGLEAREIERRAAELCKLLRAVVAPEAP